MLTEVYLLKKYGPLLTLEQLGEVLHYAVGTLENKHAAGKLGIKLLKRGSKLLAHYSEVARVVDTTESLLSSD